jgi:hypothetical protein
MVLGLFVVIVMMTIPCLGEVCPMVNVSVFTNHVDHQGVFKNLAVVANEDYVSQIDPLLENTSYITVYKDPVAAFDALATGKNDSMVFSSVGGEKIIQAKGIGNLRSFVIGQMLMYRIVIPDGNYNIGNTFKQTHASFEKN